MHQLVLEPTWLPESIRRRSWSCRSEDYDVWLIHYSHTMCVNNGSSPLNPMTNWHRVGAYDGHSDEFQSIEDVPWGLDARLEVYWNSEAPRTGTRIYDKSISISRAKWKAWRRTRAPHNIHGLSHGKYLHNKDKSAEIGFKKAATSPHTRDIEFGEKNAERSCCALCPLGLTCQQIAWSDDVGTW